jgi:hypothetical protein
MKYPFEFKAKKYNFLTVHIIGGIFAVFVAAVVLFIFYKSEIILLEILVYFSALIIAGIFILFIDTSKYDIILRANEIEGPIRFKSRHRRISVPYGDIDLYRSRKRMIFRDGFIATENGHRILISSRYFSKRDENHIFDKLKLGVKNDMQKQISQLKKELEEIKEEKGSV